jgi:hypothetical protein
MARDRNTFAKRQREVGKKQKAADKRARRLKRVENAKGAEGSSGDDGVASEQPGQPQAVGTSQVVSDSP